MKWSPAKSRRLEERKKGGGGLERSGERDEEEVGAREKSDAVKHSAVRVIRLRKSAGSTLLHFTKLPIPSYIFIHERDRKRVTLVSFHA